MPVEFDIEKYYVHSFGGVLLKMVLLYDDQEIKEIDYEYSKIELKN